MSRWVARRVGARVFHHTHTHSRIHTHIYMLHDASTTDLEQCGQLMQLVQSHLETSSAPALTALLSQAESLVVAVKAAIQAYSSATLPGLPADILHKVLMQLNQHDLASLECCCTALRAPVEFCVECKSAEVRGICADGQILKQLQPQLKISSTYRLHWLLSVRAQAGAEFGNCCNKSRGGMDSFERRGRELLCAPSVAHDDPCSFAMAVHLLHSETLSLRVNDMANTREKGRSIEWLCDVIRRAAKLRDGVPIAALDWLATRLAEGITMSDGTVVLIPQLRITANAVLEPLRLEVASEDPKLAKLQGLPRLMAIRALLTALQEPNEDLEEQSLRLSRLGGVAHQLAHFPGAGDAGVEAFVDLIHRAHAASAVNSQLLDPVYLPAWLGNAAKAFRAAGRYVDAEAAWRQQHRLYQAHVTTRPVAAMNLFYGPLCSLADMLDELGSQSLAIAVRREYVADVETITSRFEQVGSQRHAECARLGYQCLWSAQYELVVSLVQAEPDGFDWHEIEDLTRQLLAREEALEWSPVLYHRSLNQLAEALERQGKYAEAETARRRQLSMTYVLRASCEREGEGASDEPRASLHQLDERIQFVTFYLAEDLAKQGKFNVAEPFARESALAFEKPGSDEEGRADSVELMMNVLRGLERWQEADEWAAKRGRPRRERDDDAAGAAAEGSPPSKRQAVL